MKYDIDTFFFTMFGSKLIIRNSSKYVPKCRLNKKVAIVTGASCGIGLAIARRLGQEGAKVVICSRNKKNICDAVKTLKDEGLCVFGVECHVGLAKDREALVNDALNRFGAIDILVSNAGTNTPKLGSIMNCDAKIWDIVFENNVKSSFFLAKLCVPHLAKSGKGKIIFLSALAGLHPFKNLGLYSVSKTAIIGMTKALSVDLGPSNITVNAIAPGVVKTNFSKSLWDNKDISEVYLNKILMKRFGKPEEVAGVAAFLASNDASYITGETIVIAGGMQSRL